MGEVIYNMSYSDYAARPGARSNQLKTILERSPAQSRIQAPDSGAFRIGRAIHSACLTPNMFPMQFSQVTDRRTKDGKAAAALAESAGRETLTPNEWELALQIAASARKDFAGILDHGKPEVSLFWEQDGVQCKARPDWIGDDGILYDLKSTEDVSEFSFTHDATRYGYPFQLWYYLMGCQACGLKITDAKIIGAEKSPPYAARLFEFERRPHVPGPFDLAAKQVSEALEIYRTCEKAGAWPAYQDRPGIIRLAEWQKTGAALD